MTQTDRDTDKRGVRGWLLFFVIVLAAIGPFYLATIIIFPVSIFDAVSFDIAKGMASALLTAGIWTIYLRRSRRVRNTYGTWRGESIATRAADGSA